MINLDLIKTVTESRKQEVEKHERRELDKIEKKRRAETKIVNDKYDSQRNAQKQTFQIQRNEIDSEFYRRGSIELLASLDLDYQAMDTRENAVLVSEEDKAKARTYIEVIQKAEGIQDANTREIVIAGIKLGITPTVEQAMKVAQEDSNKTRNITLYLAAGKINETENGVLVIAPVRSDRSNAFSASLDELIQQTAESERVILDADAVEFDPKQCIVLRDKNSEVQIEKHKKTISNGYTLYTVIPAKPEQANKLMVGIQMRLKELEPQELIDANLRSTTQVIDAEIIKYFMKHKREELSGPKEQLERLARTGISQISYEQAAQITGKTPGTLRRLITIGKIKAGEEGYIDANSLRESLEKRSAGTSATSEENSNENVNKKYGERMIYTATAPADIRQEALARLDAASRDKEWLDSNEMKYILGSKSNSYQATVSKYPEVKEGNYELRTEGKRKLAYFHKNGLKKVIEERVPTRNGWMPKDKVKNSEGSA
jgi:hypothetical protein